MRTSKRTHTGRAARAALAAGALLLAAGCASGGDADVPEEASGSLEELARQADCDPNIQTEAEELRQANCTTADGRYILTTFATDRGQREWINEANDYGGTYLVGRKWVAVGDETVVAALRGRLGGTVETGADHGSAHDTPSGDPEDGAHGEDHGDGGHGG
ncbi:hypothetical protein NPS70_09995 [Streptomyces sp. C10-9-1]|uniref:hypothetical protein n=1 Tax=Streptomyces sp. C10-9-1 TaxID=1859285 RepID=UPI0021113F99|nr:hypothetical protein [Streptomyces sp. C10-9-1]MCQ6553525.1 hypothetical protein [Streptomyces sp. C10-9-1]